MNIIDEDLRESQDNIACTKQLITMNISIPEYYTNFTETRILKFKNLIKCKTIYSI